jgi:UDP-N-acetylmuramyl pentapeptide phosphotransferase/UDP-N-acetylglucosamine-1-phosphate transferase
MPLAVAVLVAFVASALGAGAFRQWALGRALLDVPNARSSHRQPTPRGGGVGIVLGSVLGLLVWIACGNSLSPRALGWLAGALLVASVSFADDLRGLPAPLRLGAHLFGALLLTLAGVQQGEVPLAVALVLAFAWVALVTNIYNFMDGIDGLAGSQAIVAGLALAVAGGLVANPLLTAGGALIAAAAGGFLVHNLPPPARLFMGDVGSTYLGFNFAGLSLLGNLGVGGGRLPFEFGVVVLAPFLFDGVVTLARRVVRGERWFEAHRSHYYQRLVLGGLGHGQVTGIYAGLALIAAAAGLAGLTAEQPLRQALAVVAYAPMLLVVAIVWRREAASRQQSAVSRRDRAAELKADS